MISMACVITLDVRFKCVVFWLYGNELIIHGVIVADSYTTYNGIM